MKKIFYSLAGEGLGHASRTSAMLENMDGVEVDLFTCGEAYDFFHKQGHPRLHKISGIPFGRNRNGRINALKTICSFGKFLKSRGGNIDYIKELADKHKPDLFIADFEPVMPMAARSMGRGFISIDNQHRFSRCSMAALPISLQIYAKFIGIYTEWMMPNPDLSIISTFCHTPLKSSKTTLVDPFVRRYFEEHTPSDKGYILVYYKNSSGHLILDALNLCKIKNVKVFNCPPERRVFNQFEYHDVSNAFIEALAGCSSLFGGAGNQMLGEAIYYGKPVFVIPEPNQPEQTINGFYINKLNYGMSVDIGKLNSQKVRYFLSNFGCREGNQTNGVHKAIDIINGLME